MLNWLLIVVVVGQRFVVPFGANPVSLSLVAAYAAIGLLAAQGALRSSAVRVEMFVVAVGACSCVAWLATFERTPLSLMSWLFLIALYIPFVITMRHDLRPMFHGLMRTYIRVMLVLSVVGALQLGAQLAGIWRFQDYPSMWIPPQYLEQFYNTVNPLAWDSPIVKAQAFVFLEPSILSQSCALAIIMALLMKLPAWQPVVLGLGLASAVSGTGILLLVFGTFLVILRRPELVRPSYVIAGVIGLAVVLSLPTADYLLARRDETAKSGSSGNQRFVLPFTEVQKGLAAEPLRYFIGAGPGTSERMLESGRGHAGEPVVYTIPTKIMFEYGLIAGSAFLIFLSVCMFRAPPFIVLPGTIFFMILFLNGSLLQPSTMILAWLLTSLWSDR